MITSAEFIFAVLIGAAIAMAQQPGATTNPAHDVDPAINAYLTPAQAPAGASELQQKLVERHNSAVRLLELRVNDYRRGVEPLAEVFNTARLVADAKMDLAQSDEDRVKLVQQRLEISRIVEARVEKQVQGGFGSPVDLERARLARLTAEAELLKLKQPKTTPATTRP